MQPSKPCPKGLLACNSKTRTPPPQPVESPPGGAGRCAGLSGETSQPGVVQNTPGLSDGAAESRDVRERRLAKFRQNVGRFRLYRLRFLKENMRFAAFFKIYQILKLKFLKFDKILQILRHLQFFC